MKFKDITGTEAYRGLDETLPEIETGWFKKGKVKVIIIYEDLSYKAYYKKFKNDYVFTIKKKKYMIIPDRLIIGKNPMIIYYFNNPMPIKFMFEYSKITADKLRSKAQLGQLKDYERENLAKITIDAEALNSAINSNLISKMYGTSGLTAKSLIIILVVVAVIVLIFLQVFGVVDVIGMLSGRAG